MARKWDPKTDPIGKNEHIGRRLFDEPMLMGAHDQPSFRGIDYRHFQVIPADAGKLSMDRLGQTGIDNRAKNYLKPRAENAGATRRPPKQFNGWAHVRARILEEGWHGARFPAVPSPVEGNGLEANTHHAHIDIEGDKEFAALRLRELFTNRGGIEKAETGDR